MNKYKNVIFSVLLFTAFSSVAAKNITLPNDARKVVRSTVFVMDMCAAYYTGTDIALIEEEMGVDELEAQVVFACGGLGDSLKLLSKNKDSIPTELYNDLVRGVKLTVLLAYRETLGSDLPSEPVAELSEVFDSDDYSKYYYIATETHLGKKLPQQICHILERIENTHSKQLTDKVIKTKLFCNR